MSWRNHILKEFTPQVARLTVVSDPDGLFFEEGLIQEIRQKGFELLPFEDPIAFRFVYESQYRSLWDAGQTTELVVHTPSKEIESLPFDLLQVSRKLSFNLGTLFPNLSYPVVSALDRADLDALFAAQLQNRPQPLGEHATKDFILRHVFQIALELIQQPSDLLRVLLRRHHQGISVPKVFDDRLVSLLTQSDRFPGWPLEAIVPSQKEFLSFLQENWPGFVSQWLGNKALPELSSSHPTFPNIPFDHDDVRVVVDNLFLEGFLKPIHLPDTTDVEQMEWLKSSWIIVGVQLDEISDFKRRLKRLIATLTEQIPAPDARHTVWLNFAKRWAELVVLWHQGGIAVQLDFKNQFENLRNSIDGSFLKWSLTRYAGLHNQPPVPPVMVHHISRFLARGIKASAKSKVALVVIDGLAFDQWVIMREELTRHSPNLIFQEEAAFAWVPTLTSVSRQAIFAGKSPLFFPASIQTTAREKSLWLQFWADQGLFSNEVAYEKSLGDDNSISTIENILSQPKVRVLGLVVDKVDRIMHGMELGTAGMHNQVHQWMSEGFFATLMDLLMDAGFSVVLTADHGNLEAEGCGRPSEGAIAELRGERVRVYSDQLLRATVKKSFPDAVEWPPNGLPINYLPLLAGGRSVFVSSGKRLVSHGGITVEEVIVPFVQVSKKCDETT